MVKPNFHRQLISIEAERLKSQGYVVELEKLILPHCIVDIFAQKGDHKVIIECGFCCRSKNKMKELLKIVDKVIHVPYLYARAYLYPWQIEEPWREAKEKFDEYMDNSHYDWTEQLKDKSLAMDFNWIEPSKEKIKTNI